MSDTHPNASPIPPAPQPPYAPLPQEPPLAATPAGQRVQGWSNRAWRAFGMTPWWRLVVGGLIVIIGTALIAVPFDSIRMANKIRSQAAKDALRTSLQHEVLERGRGFLVAARSFAGDDAQVAEIDSAIADIDREMAKPLAVERFQGSLDELATKIAKQTAKRDEALKRLSELAANVGKGKTDVTEKLRELADEIEMLGESIQSLDEQRTEKETERAEAATERARLEADRARLEADRARLEGKRSSKESRDDSNSTPPSVPTPPKTSTTPKPKALDKEGEITTTRIDLFGRNVLEFDNTRAVTSVGFLPGEPDAQTIRATINRDVQKFIPATISALFLTALFLFMLIARSFAGRATRGEQRAVIAESRERTESHARQLAEARLTLMRAQVEPHFLFNTLAHVQALQEIDPPQASTMLERLISYLRAAMPSMRETKSTLGREVDVVRAYLDLLKIRMGDRLKYFINVPADMNGVSLPPTMIATLVENAIKHGLEPKKEGGSIAVQVRKLEATDAHPERMEVLVADDGLGFGGADTSGTGIGLANTRERLKMLYGSQAELAVEPNAPSGVRAIIRVPIVVPETIDDAHDDEFVNAPPDSVSPFSIQVTILLAVCFGWLGVHRYYVELKRSALAQTALGILSVLTGGLLIFLIPLVLWVVLDVVWIATREFRDGKGRRIIRLRAKDAPIDPASIYMPGASSAHVSPFTLQVTALLAIFLGVLGIHRFYVGRYRTGALQAGLLTLSIITGGLPIFLLPLIMWVVLDVAWILSRDFRDANGRRIMRRDADDKRSYSATQMANRRRDPAASVSSRSIALLLAIVLGLFGAHRFYVGRVGTALAMLLTLGGLGIWWIVDIVMVACGQLKDMDGKWVSEWE